MNNESETPEVENKAEAVTTEAAVPADDISSTSEAVSNTSAESANSATQSSVDTVSATPAENPTAKAPVQIGSQRDAAAKPAEPKAVQMAKANPVELVAKEESAPVVESEPINLTEGLGADVDAEIEAALDEVSMDSLLKEMPKQDDELELNTRIKGTVSRIHGENVFVSLKGRFEGVLPVGQFKKPPEDGQMIEVNVRSLNEEDGLYELAIPGSSEAVADWSDLSVGTVLDARISGSNTGGLEAMINGIRAFIPASQIARYRVENFGEFVGQTMQCLVTEVNPEKKRLVLSRRSILDREYEAQKAELLKTLAVGDLRDGTVTKLMDFGAFVDLGGIEGLIHISKLSWDRVSHPKDILKVGEAVKVKIEKIDAANGKLSLSHRDTMDHPWEKIDEQFAVSETVTGTVTRIAQFGAFVKLAPGIEGLVHISEIAHHRVLAVKNHLKQGDQVSVKILSVDKDDQKMGLSIKATTDAPVKTEKKTEEIDEPIRDMVVAKSDEPLKGGTNRKSGGESIGLNW